MIPKNCLVSDIWLKCLLSSEAEGHDYVIYPVPKWKQLGACHLNRVQLAAGQVGSWEHSSWKWIAGYVQTGNVSWSWDLIMTDSLDVKNVTSLHFKTVHMCFLACLPSSYKPYKALISIHWKCCIYLPNIMIIRVLCTEESLNENMESHDLKPNYPGCSKKEVQAETSLSLHPSRGVNVTYYFPDNEWTGSCETPTPPGSSLGN